MCGYTQKIPKAPENVLQLMLWTGLTVKLIIYRGVPHDELFPVRASNTLVNIICFMICFRHRCRR